MDLLADVRGGRYTWHSIFVDNVATGAVSAFTDLIGCEVSRDPPSPSENTTALSLSESGRARGGKGRGWGGRWRVGWGWGWGWGRFWRGVR